MSAGASSATAPADAVAVIGMSGRFPGASDLDAFWRNLRGGVESVSSFSDDELRAAGVDPAVLDLPDHVKAGAIVDGIDLFDAAFFGISPREAAAMDPQHRLFLECAWEALENAGYDPQRCPRATAVYGGCSLSTYHLHQVLRHREQVASMGASQVNAGSATDFLTMRVSYLLDLSGPSITLHTACSTSLVAVAQAWHALMGFQCDMALAGGVTLRVPQKGCYSVAKEAILSPDGHCRPFDHRANGTASGEGVGVVVLKRLEDALRDGDAIRAVIRGVGLNNEGYDKVSIYAPSVRGQAEVVAMALSLADVDPSTIGYVEAHGTGTALGDPIEVAALTQAFRARTAAKSYCALGAVKANIGHTEAAAGVAGLIKTVLMLEHAEIPPMLHFEKPNPQIDFASSPFFVNTALRAWTPIGGAPRRAGVSSFGLGGTNAHAVLEEAPAAPVPAPSRAPQLLLLSAKSEAALERATDRLAAHLRAHPALALADVAYTLHAGRGAYAHRRALVCGEADDAAAALAARAPARVLSGRATAEAHPVAFLFPGQGAQYAGMGRGLREHEPVFREELDRCAELLRPHLGLDLRTVLWPSAAEADEAARRLTQTALAQPALFAVEYALAKLWLARGVRPRVMAGHSVGELVAATLAGVIALPDALRVVAARGRLMQELPPGEMLGVALAESEVRPLLDGELSLSAVNAPAACVVSGPAAAVSRLREALAARDVACRPLHTSHAFHSAMMEPIVAPFTALLREVALSPAQIACVSTVTGRLIDPGDWARPEYWAANLRQPVRFAEAARTLLAQRELVLLEVGPGRTLGALVKQQGAAAQGRAAIASMRHPQDEADDREVLLEAAGRLWVAGVSLDVRALHPGPRRRVPLPTYPFERKRFWVGAEPGAEALPAAPYPLVRRHDVGAWFWAPSWQRALGAAGDPDLGGRWLLLADEQGVGARLAARLPDAVLVRAGDAFRRDGPRAFTIRPGARADYDALLDALATTDAPLLRVVHLWNVVAPAPLSPGPDALARAQDGAFYSLLFLAQALAERLRGAQSARIAVVANDLFEVTGHEAVRPERATAVGPCRVVPRELENVRCVLVDVQLPSREEGWRALTDQLLAESACASGDPVVAYRGPHRWVPGFQPRPLPPASSQAAWRRPGLTWLITGGLGGIGLALADVLAEHGANLVLLGRRGLPPRAQWEALLAAGDDPALCTRLRAVRALEQRGAAVEVLAGDVADAGRMREVVRAAKQRFGAIDGVVHAAGLATGGMVALRTREAAAEVLDPKVAGTLVLQEVLRGEPLVCFALCSALASVQGGVGAADYCGANAFLDALVHSDRGRDTPFVALGWDIWGDVGMAAQAATSEAMRAGRARHLARGIRAAEGADAFARALSSGLRQLYVATSDLPALLAADRASAAPATEAAAPASAPTPAPARHERPALATPYEAPASETEREIAAIAAELLGIDRVGAQDNLFELGFDSLLGYMLIARLKKRFRVEPPLRTILASPTARELAKYVEAAQWVAGM